ncbi:SNF2-related protein [Vibrio fluvialis]|uniref:SNF2-related protein n=1 Tax=Vibrio fluvialis TaxID=676 RepID=UPI001F46542A|nr:SNF2-related protein [Vibrio fluvialis]MCE7600598.1 SNF2-related protein [Vibrio fluvialis]
MTTLIKTYYGKLTREEDSRWKLSDIKPHVSLRLTHLFPRISQGKLPPYYLNDALDIASDLTWFMTRYPFEMSEGDEQYLNSQNNLYLEKQASNEAILNPDYKPKERIGFKSGRSLRAYQAVAVDFAESVQSALILDEIGLGKTIEGLGLATIPESLPLVIVVQPHLHQQWYDKALEFMEAEVHKVEGNKPYSLPTADIYIMKYNQLPHWIDVLTQGWVKGIAFDEIQELRRGADALKGYAAKQICQVVTYKVGLTASLIYNYGIESFNIASILRPGILGTREEFLREWCTEKSDKGIVKDPDALGAYLREQSLIIRRTKEDVGQQAKQLTPHVEWVDHSSKAVSDLEELTKQLAMKTFSLDFSEAGQASREFDLKMRQMTGVAKAKQVAAYVRMFVNSGEPVLLYGWHREVYNIWMNELSDLNPIMFTGSETPKQKEKAKQSFINGESKVLIMSLGSGAGIDGLQHVCSTVVFGEFAWSSEIHRQCIGRIDRDGQKKEVFTFYVATNFGSDPEIIDVLGLKSNQSDGIMNPYKGGEIAKQTDANRIKKLAAKYLESQGLKVPKKESKPKASKPEKDINSLLKLLQSGSFSVMDEKVTQSQIESLLTNSNVMFEREKRFGSGIVDFFLPETEIALEVKANKQWSKMEVFRQCERYCKEQEVKGIVLATAKIQGLPNEIAGKPAKTFQLSLTSL